MFFRVRRRRGRRKWASNSRGSDNERDETWNPRVPLSCHVTSESMNSIPYLLRISMSRMRFFKIHFHSVIRRSKKRRRFHNAELRAVGRGLEGRGLRGLHELKFSHHFFSSLYDAKVSDIIRADSTDPCRALATSRCRACSRAYPRAGLQTRDFISL